MIVGGFHPGGISGVVVDVALTHGTRYRVVRDEDSGRAEWVLSGSLELIEHGPGYRDGQCDPRHTCGLADA